MQEVEWEEEVDHLEEALILEAGWEAEVDRLEEDLTEVVCRVAQEEDSILGEDLIPEAAWIQEVGWSS